MARDVRELLGEGRGRRRAGVEEGAIQRELGRDDVRARYEASPFRGLAVPAPPPDLIRLIAQVTGVVLRQDQWEEIERLRAFFGISGVGHDPKLATWRAGEPARRAPAVITEVEPPRPRAPRATSPVLPEYDPNDLGD